MSLSICPALDHYTERRGTSRPYFRDHPQIAIQLLSAHREDASEYVRKSVGNASDRWSSFC